MALELAWGRLRRAWLRRFRGGYVRRMRACRQGTTGNYPHDILDPRDLKYFRNQGDLHWRVADDPFAWRDHLPFARVGLGEILMVGGICLILAGVGIPWGWPLTGIAVVPALFALWFFRDPRRRIPSEPGTRRTGKSLLLRSCRTTRAWEVRR
jgi:phosphatidylserine decarboxylase